VRDVYYYYAYSLVERVDNVNELSVFSHFIRRSIMDIQISSAFETRQGKRCFNVENYKFSEFRVLKSGDL